MQTSESVIDQVEEAVCMCQEDITSNKLSAMLYIGLFTIFSFSILAIGTVTL